LYREDYCKEVKGFIYFALSNPKNISGYGIRYSCVKCKNQNFHQSNIVMMHLFLKKKLLRNTCVNFYTKNHMFLMTLC
jgi:hypothetical protein